ncbi:MAG: hypothetical protein ACLQNE_29095 [Thermoguttaceae bacterium]
MESISRDVRSLESDERRLYESVVGHALGENQRVIIHVIELAKGPDESVRAKAVEEFHELCREGTENRERQGISVEQADQVLEEAVQAARSHKRN